MGRAKVTDADVIDFLIVTPKQATATEAARSQPAAVDPRVAAAAHDAYTRPLHRLEPDAGVLWAEVEPDVRRKSGVLVVDDSVLDKPYARQMALVHRQYSGKHHRVVKGIGLVTLLWTDGDRHLPCDYRLYDKAEDGKAKNDHFGDLLATAAARGFAPECVLFDTWYSGLANLKRCRDNKWRWLTRFRSNRRVNPDRTGERAVSECEIAATGTAVHLAGYGMVKVSRIAATDGTAAHWATDDLAMDDLTRLRLAEASWRIEEYHRGLEQTTNVERCQCRVGRAQRNHTGLPLRAFVLLERHCFRTGVNWLSAKWDIAREAVRAYRANPVYRTAPA